MRFVSSIKVVVRKPRVILGASRSRPRLEIYEGTRTTIFIWRPFYSPLGTIPTRPQKRTDSPKRSLLSLADRADDLPGAHCPDSRSV